MKRRDLLRHLEEHGCVMQREGASHTLYGRPDSAHKEAVPRHAEIKKHLARSICKNLNVPPPKGA